VRRYRDRGIKYWKPVQTGIEQDDDTAEVQRLSGCGPEIVLDEGVRLPRPLSPHLAARLSGSVVELDSVLAIVSAQPRQQRWIVEGAGGVLVPLNERELIVDLMVRLELPAVIVSRSGLGTINHTLLTVEALGARSLTIAGVVMVGAQNAENRRAIERYGGVTVLGEMPMLEPLVPASVQRWADEWLDPDRRLGELLA
jgi:dethiobiotin synthase